MKIAYIHNNPMPNRAANGVQVSKMCQAFSDHGHDTALLVPREGWHGAKPDPAALKETYGIDASFRLHSVPMPHHRGGGLIFSVLAALRARMMRPDLVYSRCVRSSWMSALLGAPTVFEMHSAREDFSPSGRLAFDRLMKSPNLVRLVTISGAIADDLSASHPDLKSRIVVAPSGSDLAPGEAAADPMGPRTGRMRVGYIGHLYPGKGMEIIAPLLREASWADFHIVGGMDADIERWKGELAAVPNVTLHGFKRNSELPSYYRHLDVFLAPYQRNVRGSDGKADLSRWMSPMKLFEYMAYGKPILCSDLPSLHEILTDDENVLFCSPDRVEDWASALHRIEADPALASRLGSAAKELLVEKYTWDARAKRVLEGLA